MTPVLPPPRKVPVVPRPRHGELSGSYLARVARANRTDLRSFLSLLGSLPSALPSESPDLAVMVLTLNEAAFARLLAYTGLDGEQLIRAYPVASPQGDLPARRVSRHPPLVREDAGSGLPWVPPAPRRRPRRHPLALTQDGVPAPRLLAARAGRRAAPEPGRDPGGRRRAAAPRPDRVTPRARRPRCAPTRSPAATCSTPGGSTPIRRWYPDLLERWQQRIRTAGAISRPVPPGSFPAGRSTRNAPRLRPSSPARTGPLWRSPSPDRRHRLFYQRLLTELAVDEQLPCAP